jgi:hypothetical protein
VVDRALTFSDPEIVNMLKNDFVPVAIDQWYQRQQQDAEGEFYRKVAGQGSRNDFEKTTQGRYICSADGILLGYNNNRGPGRVRLMMKAVLADFNPKSLASVQPLEPDRPDAKFHLQPPVGGLILRVNSKILGGYQPANDWTAVFHDAIGRDNAWINADEKQELLGWIKNGGDMPERLAARIFRFHLIDNTRGEPPHWQHDEVKELRCRIDEQGMMKGFIHLETKDETRGYRAELLGIAKTDQQNITRFDLVAKGECWGEGRYTGGAPRGKFPLAVAFRIADGSDPADTVAPHGMKGWAEGYFK